MKRFFLKQFFLFVVVFLILTMPLTVMAQIGGGCDPLDPGCPIDGGLSALLVLGAGYGIRKVRQARKAVDPE